MNKKTNNQSPSTNMSNESISILSPKDKPKNKQKKELKEKFSFNFISRKRKNRQINSLDELSKKFIRFASDSIDGCINLNVMMKKIKAKKRRIYDITNVLEGK